MITNSKKQVSQEQEYHAIRLCYLRSTCSYSSLVLETTQHGTGHHSGITSTETVLYLTVAKWMEFQWTFWDRTIAALLKVYTNCLVWSDLHLTITHSWLRSILSMKQECLEGKQICLRTLTPYARKASLFLDGLVLSTELIMDGGLTLETSALETPYGGQFTKSTQLIK